MNSKIGFGIVDWIVFISVLLISMLIGFFYAFIRKQVTNSDLLLGNQKMPIYSITLSLGASYMNAILVLGFAGEIYSYGSIISEVALGALFWIPIAGLLFLPTFYPLKLTSVYEYLELRFESVVVRLFACGTFILQIILFMGVVVFAPSIAFNTFLDFPVWGSILLLGISSGLYSSLGGLRAVVLTDAFQILIMISGILSIIIKGVDNLGGLGNVYQVANRHRRIEFFNFEIDPFKRHTSLSLFFGNGLFWLSAFGCHQITVQRYCAMSSLKKAFISIFLSAPFIAITIGLSCLAGVVIFANFAHCDPITLGNISKPDQIAPHFVSVFLSGTSGLVGLFMACLYSGALSTISSAINSLSAVTWQDFLKKFQYFDTLPEAKQGLVTKILGLIYTIVIIAVGLLASNMGSILKTNILVNGSVTGPLLGVFLLGVFVPFSNKHGALFGMLLSHFIVLWISFGGLGLNMSEKLPLSTEECDPEFLISDFNSTQYQVKIHQEILEWPRKLYSISYLLYPLIGTLITLISGSIISLITGGSKLDKEKMKVLLHPIIYKISVFYFKPK